MKPARARQLVEYLRTSYRISIRRACGALRFDRSRYHYKHRRPEQASLRKRIRELSEARVRYGYRRIHVLLRREGWTINHKRTRRLYREEGLQLRRKTPKRKVSAKRREDRVAAVAANDCWSMDFLSDQLFDGRKIRVLTIVDNFTRVSPAIDVRSSYRGADVVTTLERIASAYGRPKRIHGKARPTAALGSRGLKPPLTECLNTYWFLSLDDARVKCEAWRRDYNEVRPHSAIGNQTPIARAFASGRACLT